MILHKIADLFVQLNKNNLSLHYVDEEDSVIPVNSICEFEEAVRLTKIRGKPVKLFFSDNKSQTYFTMSLNVKKSTNEESQCNENTAAITSAITLDDTSCVASADTSDVTSANTSPDTSPDKKTSPDSEEITNNNSPPDWFVCYMEKFKKDLISEVKSSIAETVENIITKKKKLCYFKTDDQFWEKYGALSPEKNLTKKKKKISEKDLMDVTEQKGLKMKKLERLFPTKSEKLEKLDSKTKFMLEERKKVLEKKRSAKIKTEKNVDMSDVKNPLPLSAVFEEAEVYLSLPPEANFVLFINVVNNGKYTWRSPKIESFDFKEFRPDPINMAIPEVCPGEKWHIMLRGKACKTLGLHHFKCRVVENKKIISPDFTCFAIVEHSNEPQEKQSHDVIDSVPSSQPIFGSGDSDDIIDSSEKKIQENIMKIKERLHHICLIENPDSVYLSKKSKEPFVTLPHSMQNENVYLNERERVLNEREKNIKKKKRVIKEKENGELYTGMPELKEPEHFRDSRFYIDYVPLSDPCLAKNQEDTFSSFHDIKKVDEGQLTDDEVDDYYMYNKDMVEDGDDYDVLGDVEFEKKRFDEEFGKLAFKNLIQEEVPYYKTSKSLMTYEMDHNSSRLLPSEVVKSPMEEPPQTETLAETCREELNPFKDENDEIKNESSGNSSDSEISLLCMTQEDDNFIMLNLRSRSCSPAKSVHEDKNSNNGDLEIKTAAINKQLESLITKKKSPEPKHETAKEAEFQYDINQRGYGSIEEAQIPEEIEIQGKNGDQKEGRNKGVDLQKVTNLEKREISKEFHQNSQSPSRSRRSPFGEEIIQSKLKKIKSKSTEYHFTTENLTHPTFTILPERVGPGPSQFIFTGEKERMRSPPEKGFEAKSSQFTFTAEKEETRNKKDSRGKDVFKTDSVGRVIYAVSSSGYCLPVEDVFEIDGNRQKNVSEMKGDGNQTHSPRQNANYQENPGVITLPNVLMNGASSAFNRAKSVINNLAFVTEGITELKKLVFEEKKKNSMEEALLTLFEMGFFDIEKNLAFLFEYNNDLRKVVEELVRQSKASEQPQ